ncbi:Gfo/Idh/MocA family oxidoreductase [Paenibacillus rhizovicinus]|uniref:Gfo/Idh/MocA family oxidoreductase n=1 Tax=Paenibacillus rhizovicinus TaxID=2704463 RepID=A0A6C0P6L9_9BACL|nr:Gfo/Idh/MocA family oxidoreductase [Paenibacillus rhizovicinus]QHW34001.1 Gfo/Idh/MocA family oxidoreductase [Paenibacillus rhizovicinus]
MRHRVVIIGAGNIAVSHLEALRKMTRLEAVAVADVQEQRASKLADEYGIHAYADYRAMIEQEKPDVAVITLPHFLHKEAAVWCAEAGCHILLEKPMALNAAECDEIIAAVKASQVRLLVGHTQHYLPENRKAAQLIRQGDLGELLMINDTRHMHYYRDSRPDWFLEQAKAGGGILTNLGSHSLDKIQWFGGAPIAKVRASVSYFGPRGDVEGSGLVYLENENGLPATISQSGYAVVPRNETELVFTKGMLKVLSGQSLWISEGETYVQVPVEDQTDPFILQFEDLIDHIETGKPLACSMEYSRSIVAAVDAIYASHANKTEWTVRSDGHAIHPAE